MTLHEFITNPGTTHTFAVAAGFAINWIVAFVKRAPAPKTDQLWIGAAFDATQDVAKNNERIGERRKDPNAPAP